MQDQMWSEVSLDQGHNFHTEFLFLLHRDLSWNFISHDLEDSLVKEEWLLISNLKYFREAQLP